MSLHFSQDQDPLSKREKQEKFKRSLDEQRRMKQETSAQQQYHNLSSNTCTSIHGPAPACDVRVIPGLNQNSRYAHRFEGSPSSPRQYRQPYMSALSEMNGRPLHVRQQQFQKESQYRNMLMEQIEENKKRKEAEKAKLDAEKRRELEEVRLLQGIPAPRRQQHAQFQESPDHPLPSPGRFPPAGYNPATADQHQQQQRWRRGGHPPDRSGVGIPVHGIASSGYPPMDPPEISGPGGEGRGRGQRHAPAFEQDQVDGDHKTTYGDPLHETTSACHIDGHDQRAGDAGRPQGRFDAAGQAHSGENAARKSTSERSRSGEAEGGGSATRAVGDSSDTVPRADFDELSNLCRDLLLEQKQLRRKLEERQEREQLATEGRQEEKLQRRRQPQPQPQRGIPRPGGTGTRDSGGTTVGNGDGRRRAPSLSGSRASRVQGNSARESIPRRDSKPNSKSAVAFGSTRSRMPNPAVEKPRVTSDVSRPQLSKDERASDMRRSPAFRLERSSHAFHKRDTRGGRDARVSKSEPVPRTENLLDLRQLRNVISRNGGSGGSGGKLYTGLEPSDSGLPRDDSRRVRDSGSVRFAGADRAFGGGDRTSHNESGSGARGASASEVGYGGNSTHGILRNGSGRDWQGAAQGEADAAHSYGG